MTNELFIAEKGKGAFLNGEKITVSNTKALKGALLATGFPYNVKENPLSCIEQFTKFVKMKVRVKLPKNPIEKADSLMKESQRKKDFANQQEKIAKAFIKSGKSTDVKVLDLKGTTTPTANERLKIAIKRERNA